MGLSPPVLVNLGCGCVYHPAWRNYDLDPQHPSVTAINITEPLPLETSSAEGVYHAHVLEHLAPATGQRLMTDCFRVLKPGGVVRVAVPDLETLALRYLTALTRGDELEHDWAVIELIDQMVRSKSEGAMGNFLREQPWRERAWIRERIGTEVGAGQPADPSLPWKRHRRPARALARLRFALGRLWLNQREAEMLREAQFRASGEVHRWMYDRFSLARLLRTVGFVDAVRRTATESAIPQFADYLLDTDPTGAARHPDSLYMEAVKPC